MSAVAGGRHGATAPGVIRAKLGGVQTEHGQVRPEGPVDGAGDDGAPPDERGERDVGGGEPPGDARRISDAPPDEGGVGGGEPPGDGRRISDALPDEGGVGGGEPPGDGRRISDALPDEGGVGGGEPPGDGRRISDAPYGKGLAWTRRARRRGAGRRAGEHGGPPSVDDGAGAGVAFAGEAVAGDSSVGDESVGDALVGDASAAGVDERRAGGPVASWWRRRSGRVRLLQVAVVIAVALAGYYVITLAQVWSTGRSDESRPVDAIVVLGAAQYDGRPSPQLAARLDHVVELWPDGLAPTVFVTGGNQPGDRFTEAEASAAYLIDRGIPAEAILAEDAGSTTYESMAMVADLIGDRGDRVLIVTDPYHTLRSRLIAEEVGLTAYVSPTDMSVVTGGESLRRHLQEAAGVAVGRLIGFERLSRLTD